MPLHCFCPLKSGRWAGTFPWVVLEPQSRDGSVRLFFFFFFLLLCTYFLHIFVTHPLLVIQIMYASPELAYLFTFCWILWCIRNFVVRYSHLSSILFVVWTFIFFLNTCNLSSPEIIRIFACIFLKVFKFCFSNTCLE